MTFVYMTCWITLNSEKRSDLKNNLVSHLKKPVQTLIQKLEVENDSNLQRPCLVYALDKTMDSPVLLFRAEGSTSCQLVLSMKPVSQFLLYDDKASQGRLGRFRENSAPEDPPFIDSNVYLVFCFKSEKDFKAEKTLIRMRNAFYSEFSKSGPIFHIGLMAFVDPEQKVQSVQQRCDGVADVHWSILANKLNDWLSKRDECIHDAKVVGA